MAGGQREIRPTEMVGGGIRGKMEYHKQGCQCNRRHGDIITSNTAVASLSITPNSGTTEKRDNWLLVSSTLQRHNIIRHSQLIEDMKWKFLVKYEELSTKLPLERGFMTKCNKITAE